jgi:hypothetical protein
VTGVTAKMGVTANLRNKRPLPIQPSLPSHPLTAYRQTLPQLAMHLRGRPFARCACFLLLLQRKNRVSRYRDPYHLWLRCLTLVKRIMPMTAPARTPLQRRSG